MGEVVALGDELRADHDVHLAGRDRGQLLPQPLRAAWKIAGEHDAALVRKQRRGLLGDAFDPRPAGDERVERAAGHAGLGPALGVAAMVADQRAAEAVLYEPSRTIGAFVTMGAGAAE